MGNDGGALHEFVTSRYPGLRRSAFLMCGDWAQADQLTQRSLARVVAECWRTTVDDPDAFAYSHLMAAAQRRRHRRRRHLFVAAPREEPGLGWDAAPRQALFEGSAAAPLEGPGWGWDAAPRQALPESSAAAPLEEAALGWDGAPQTSARVPVNATPPATGVVGAVRVRASGISSDEGWTASRAGSDAAPRGTSSASAAGEDPARAIVVLDALDELAPRCRAVVVLRHWDGFGVDEVADMLGLADRRVDAYDTVGRAALGRLLAVA